MRIRKNKEAILSLILSIIIPLSACGVKMAPIGSKPPVEVTVENDVKFGHTYETRLERKIALENFKSYLNTISTNYLFLDHYLSDEELDALIESSNTQTRCLKRYERDVDSIINRIRYNSVQFLPNHPEFTSAFWINDETDGTSRKLFEKALREALEIMMQEDNDLDEDIHRMEDLVIVFGDGKAYYDLTNDEDAQREYLVLGYYDHRVNVMVVDPEAIYKITESKGPIKGLDVHYDTMLETVMHELNHVRQTACDCRKEQNENLLNSVRYGENLSSGLTEASAESELYNLETFPFNKYRSAYDYSYSDERNEEAMILLMALFNENASIEDYYQAIFDTDYQALYNFLNLNSREDIELFYRVLYSMDAILLRNDLAITAYDNLEQEHKTLYDFRCDLGYDYLIDLYRFVLDRMSTYTYNHDDLELEDNLILLDIVQDIICNMCFTIGDNSRESYLRFRNNLINMDHAYKTFLCSTYNVTMEDINKARENAITYEMALDDQANGDTYFRLRYTKKSKALLERFPILTAILRNREYIHGNYERVIMDDDFTLRLK